MPKRELGFLKTIHMSLIIPILFAIIIGALSMAQVSHSLSTDVIITAAMEDGQRSARILRDFVELAISTAKLDLSALRVHPSVRRLFLEQESPEELQEYMRELIDRQPLYNNMLAINTAGVVVASDSGVIGGDRSDRAYFAAGLLGQNFISEVETSRLTGQLALFLTTPVFDEEDEVIGIILASILVEEISHRYVTPVTLQGGFGYAMIVSRTGSIIGHADSTMLAALVPEDLLQHIAEGNTEAITFDAVVGGVLHIVFMDYCYSTDWFSLVLSPRADFYSAVNHLSWASTVLVAFIIVALTAAVWVAVRGVTKALSTTIRYADEISRGNLDSKLSIVREDEIGVLARSLARMVQSLKSMISVAEQKTREAEEATEAIIAGISYASKIQRDLLPRAQVFKKAFADSSIIWRPRDIVGGDFYWMKSFEGGTVLAVCDCTGHGTSGALLTVLVVSALEAVVQQEICADTAEIIWQLEQRLLSRFNIDAESRSDNEIQDGCDIAVLFIAKEGAVTLSSGNIPVFACDGKEVRHIKGQRINVGEGRLMRKEEIQTVQIASNPANKFYIASDGLFDQPGEVKPVPFGYAEFKRIILENHEESLAVITEKVWASFESYRGMESQIDDFELIAIKP